MQSIMDRALVNNLSDVDWVRQDAIQIGSTRAEPRASCHKHGQ